MTASTPGVFHDAAPPSAQPHQLFAEVTGRKRALCAATARRRCRSPNTHADTYTFDRPGGPPEALAASFVGFTDKSTSTRALAWRWRAKPVAA